ncbi:MAG TPA: ROK family protein [Candidatus Agrococcus pullicola]|uniref:ROK family protein n=1 Tax=Candidatus Agrococcus pullicola TaxID=2838429 RepID=A0A9D1YW99_9MICO|nr:ROK family protein [Candidatus Agrococcus pullicola]
MTAHKAVGVDIGGTGVKAALVDVETGELLSERHKVATPKGGEPEDIVAAVTRLLSAIGEPDAEVGITFPAIVRQGKTMSAANVSDRWIGLDAESLFEKSLGRDITFVNDADAAGVAEQQYGAAKDQQGLVIVTTLGTGIGTAFIYRGVLQPNTELGHLHWKGTDSAETLLSARARERRDLGWREWGGELAEYYRHLELLFSPELFVISGGVSKRPDRFVPFIDIATPIAIAKLKNNAGIIGAAHLAHLANAR